MVALLMVSPAKAAGKTTICAGLAKYYSTAGRKVDYLRVVADGEPIEAGQGDAVFMKRVLALTEDVESICSPAGKLKEAYARVSTGKDLVIVEGVSGTDGDIKMSYPVTGALTGKVIVVESYSTQPPGSSYDEFGKNLLGVILNRVPKSQLRRVRDHDYANFAKAGISILGVIPEDRMLFSLSISQLAESIQGKILNSAEKSAELVENFMVGAMCVDSGLDYFSRKTNKAAILRSDRPDMQLAALETTCRCMILSGTTPPPIYSVYSKAEHKGVPIIAVEGSISDIVTAIEAALGTARFNQERKLPRLTEIMQEHLDFKAVTGGLGLSG